MIKQMRTRVYSRCFYTSMLGPITIQAGVLGLARVDWGEAPEQPVHDPGIDGILTEAVKELSEYFNGQRREFSLPIDWSGMTLFQEAVLRACYAIPFGSISTYGELARRTGRPNAARAVGFFMASNPLPILIPCHRVVGTDRRLHGYGGPGGLQNKVDLLVLEGHTVVAQKLV